MIPPIVVPTLTYTTVKALYFFYYGSLGAVMPYLPMYVGRDSSRFTAASFSLTPPFCLGIITHWGCTIKGEVGLNSSLSPCLSYNTFRTLCLNSGLFFNFNLRIGYLGAISPAITFLVSPLWALWTDKTGKLKQAVLPGCGF